MDKSPFPLFFDSIGTLSQVLRDVDAEVPRTFGAESDKFIDRVKDIVRNYATQNGWERIYLNLSKGLARQELDELISEHAIHQGAIVIDPTSSTPEHQVYQHYTEVRSCRERLARANESTSDIMLILYGLDKIDLPVVFSHMMRRLRMVAAVLELLPADAFASLSDRQNAMFAEIKRLSALLTKLTGLQTIGHMTESDMRIIMDSDGNRIVGTVFLLYAALQAMKEHGNDPAVQQTLEMLGRSIKLTPTVYAGAGLDFGIYNRAALDLGGEEKPPEAQDAHHPMRNHFDRPAPEVL